MAWVSDDVFAAGGDFIQQQWAEFERQAGLCAVVLAAEDYSPWPAGARPWALLWLPVAAEMDYTLEHFRLGTDFIQRAVAAGRKVLLHGPRGMHRTRPLFAAHLLASGQSLAKVTRAIQQKPWLPPYHGDLGVLEQWSQQVKL